VQPLPTEQSEKSTASEWSERPERSNLFTIRLIVWIALTLGRSSARLFLYPISFYFYLRAKEARSASSKYLHKVLQREPGFIDHLRHFHTFSATILDRVFLLNGRYDKFDIRVHMDEASKALLNAKQGCILLGAHFGSFEITRAYANEVNGPPAMMVMYEKNALKLNAVLNAINPLLSQRVIGLGQIDSMLKVEQALQRGEFIGILADRGLDQGNATLPCEFLGESANFPTGPMRMAYILKQPVLLMAGIYRGGNHYDLYFEQLIDMNTLAEMSRKEALKTAIQLYAEGIEKHCRNAPYNWFNFFDFWKP
jgi:predicted LPLAT superfamily acyltransferase